MECNISVLFEGKRIDNHLQFLFRSPSPEPIYDQQGKRQNTREVRARRKIEEQRHQLVAELLVLNPEYKAPGDYKYVLIV